MADSAPSTPPAPADPSSSVPAPAAATGTPPAPAGDTKPSGDGKAPDSQQQQQSKSLLTAEEPAPDSSKDGQPSDPPAPVELDIKPPDGVALDDKRFQAFKQFAVGNKLPKEVAQSILDMYAENLREYAKGQQNTWATQMAEWAKATKEDPEYGQQNLAANLTIARKALDKYGTKGLREVLDAQGLGNHPELVRFFVRVGKSLAEDSVTGAVAGQPPQTLSAEEKFLRAMYPTMFNDKKE